MTEWANEKVIEFVKDYRSFPCLWMSTSLEYKDRAKRIQSLNVLKNKYNIGSEKIVLNKIKCLRSYFHRVHNEYMSKVKTVRNTIDVPKPSWFLYDLLFFILDREENTSENKTNTSAFNEDGDEGQGVKCGDDHPEAPPMEEDKLISDVEEENDPDIPLQKNRSSSDCWSKRIREEEKRKLNVSDCLNHSINKKQKMVSSENNKSSDETFHLLRSVNQNLKGQDHISSFGIYITDKIKNLNCPRLQALAQMRIQQVLFDLEMSTFNHRQSVEPSTTQTSIPPGFVACNYSNELHSSQHSSNYSFSDTIQPEITDPLRTNSPEQQNLESPDTCTLKSEFSLI